MDEADDAQKAERLHLADALARCGPVGRPGFRSLAECIDCGEPIPDKRRLAIPGCVRCRACQEGAEKSHLS